MKFTLPRQEISKDLNLFVAKRIRQEKIDVSRVSRIHLNQIAVITREIQRAGLPKYLVIKKLKKGLGSGVFLHPKAEPILKGAVIGPYSGEVVIGPQYHGENSDYVFAIMSNLVLTKQEQKMFDPKSRYHPRRIYSLDVDAYKKGNFTRFINHSHQPNVEAHLVHIPKNSLGLEPSPFEMIYIAKKTIQPGEQLLICYEGDDDSYWGVAKIKPLRMTPKTFRLSPSLKVMVAAIFYRR